MQSQKCGQWKAYFENTFTYNDGANYPNLSEGVDPMHSKKKGCNVLAIAGNVFMQAAAWLNWVIIGTPTVQAPEVTIQASFPAGPSCLLLSFKFAIVGLLAASIAAAGAANYATSTVGTVSGNNLAFTAATGNSDSYENFTNNLANAFASNSGGVWNFDGAAFGVNSGETITLSYGTSQASNLVLTTAFNGSDKAKQRTQAVYCMNNGKQLQLGWLMFAGDNNEKLIPVVNGGAGNSWVGGWLDWTTASDNTNTINLASDRIALIAPYLA